jgi:hypothetical protein
MSESVERAPAVEFKRAACSKCGAKTETEAGRLCRPVQDISGEYECPGEFDPSGYCVVPTKESLKALDQWCQRQMEQPISQSKA